MFCILIDRRNDVKMFKNQFEPRSADEWFHYKVFNIMMSFLWSLRVQTVENCCRFFFTMTLTVLNVHSSWTFLAEKEKNKLRHHWAISIVCTLIEQSSLPISAREIAQLL